MRQRIAALLLICLTGCFSGDRFGPRRTPVTHIVLCWLKHPGNETDRQKLVNASYELARIPGVSSITAGSAIPSTRPVVDSSFDVAIVFTFADQADLDNYEQHPAHKKAVSEVLKPLTAKLLIYDVKRIDPSVTKR